MWPEVYEITGIVEEDADDTSIATALLILHFFLHFRSIWEHPRIKGPVEASLAARRRLVCGEG